MRRKSRLALALVAATLPGCATLNDIPANDCTTHPSGWCQYYTAAAAKRAAVASDIDYLIERGL